MINSEASLKKRKKDTKAIRANYYILLFKILGKLVGTLLHSNLSRFWYYYQAFPIYQILQNQFIGKLSQV